MEFLTGVYFVYIFVGIYFLSFFILIYLRNRKDLWKYPKLTKKYSISFVIPAYNEEDSIRDTLNSILAIDYPIKRVIVVNDSSTDKTKQIIQEIMKKDKRVFLINNLRNSGKASIAINKGLKYVNTELVAVSNADSYPEPDCLKKMIGWFDDKKVGVATSSILVKNKTKFIERLQAIEYAVIAWTRKLLGYVDAIYVTPGPLAVYRTEIFDKIGYFDEKNLTEDIELTWRLVKYGYSRKMTLDARVDTTVPNSFRNWYRQRIRWNLGGLQTIGKYKKDIFSKTMLGFYILPYFTLTLLLGVVGLGIFAYLTTNRILLHYLSTSYSLTVQTALLASQGINMNASVLNFFGFTMFFLGGIFTIMALTIMNEKELRDRNVFNLLFYLIIYLAVYPFIMIVALYKLARGDLKW